MPFSQDKERSKVAQPLARVIPLWKFSARLGAAKVYFHRLKIWQCNNHDKLVIYSYIYQYISMSVSL